MISGLPPKMTISKYEAGLIRSKSEIYSEEGGLRKRSIPGTAPVPALESRLNRYHQTDKVGRGIASQSPQAAPATNMDPVNLSPRALELIRMNRLIQNMPETRSEKAEGIRKFGEVAAYSVPGDPVAESIIRELLTDQPM